MTDTNIHTEPAQPSDDSGKSRIWIRGLQVIILAVLFGVAETILFIMAVLQFGWMLFTGKRNEAIAGFGTKLGRWLADVAAFQTGATEDKPFPWREFGR